MKCEFCAKGLKWTFNMNNRCCQVKWLRAAHKPAARQWLKAYKAEHGEAAMLELIAEVNNERPDPENRSLHAGESVQQQESNDERLGNEPLHAEKT